MLPNSPLIQGMSFLQGILLRNSQGTRQINTLKTSGAMIVAVLNVRAGFASS